MNIRTGTSGFAYREWRGKFYPSAIKPAEILPFYAQRFSAVEINSTFYRMPTESVLDSWMSQVPKDFVFAFKAPALITHRKRLRNVGEETAAFTERISSLGRHLGPALFQLPPSLPCDLPLLREFLDAVTQVRAAVEFRHASWLNDEVFALLRECGCALCISDRDGAPPPPVIATADFGYARLRKSDYTDEELGEWRERIEQLECGEFFVFFRHEERGMGPVYAEKMKGGGS